jgi:hypothetical protein
MPKGVKLVHFRPRIPPPVAQPEDKDGGSGRDAAELLAAEVGRLTEALLSAMRAANDSKVKTVAPRRWKFKITYTPEGRPDEIVPIPLAATDE